jgi:hypothetical protein
LTKDLDMTSRGAFLLTILVLTGCGSGPATRGGSSQALQGSIEHVLLLSIDGMHQSDLSAYLLAHPSSALAEVAGQGVTYTGASTSRPSDSFPGLTAQVTGGGPKTTGIWYDDSFDRSLYPPGSGCTGAPGAEVVFTEAIDVDMNQLSAGGGIDPAKLPMQLSGQRCVPVYPHDYLRVNTVFEVAHAAGLRTAWSDKHPAYDLVRGPSGQGVDDLYTPEINAIASSVTAIEAYDDLKVAAVLHQIDGLDSSGGQTAPVPSIFGMNFQAVSVGQKLAGGGYTDASGTPSSSLADAFAHTDASLAKLMAELKAQGLFNSTLVILSAKHGQSPIDPSKRMAVNDQPLSSALQGFLGNGRFQDDDIVLVWLQDQGQANVQAALGALAGLRSSAAFDQGTLYSQGDVTALYDDPQEDPRTPDIIIQPNVGVIYTTGTKLAEHGGFAEDDVHVPLLVSNPAIAPTSLSIQVSTTQIAPTILMALGLNPMALQAVQVEGTLPLPGLAL